MKSHRLPYGGQNPHDARFEVRQLLHDDFVWRRRNLGSAAIHAFAPRAWDRDTVAKNLQRRGWRWPIGSSDAPLEAAPCRLCGRKAVHVSQLNDKRECRVCKPLFGGSVAA